MRASALALALLGFALAVPSFALAQGDDARASARREFQLGVAAAREERWLTARGHFERAYEQSEEPAVLVNLALAQRETGQLMASVATYERYLRGADPETTLTQQAREALASALEALPRVRVVITGLAPGDEVRVDDRVLEHVALGDVPVDPGSHTVTVARGGRDIESASFQVAVGGRTSVRVRVPSALVEATPPTAEAPPLALTPDPAPTPASGGDGSLGVVLGVTLGIVVAGAVALILGLVLTTPQPTAGSIAPGTIEL